MSPSAGIAPSSTPQGMDSNLKVLQLNIRKQAETQLSLLNDEALRDYAAIATQEPHARKIDDALITTPMSHPNWTKLVPTIQREEKWLIRSMLWVNTALNTTQIPIQSPDITAAYIKLPERSILVASIYIEPANQDLLQQALTHLRTAASQTPVGERVDILFLGDFNLYN